jgi:hypothetical protein
MKKISSAVATLSLVASSTVLAQDGGIGTIIFGRGSVAVPALGGAGLVLLGLVLAAAGMSRKGTSGHMTAVLALAVGALISSLSGLQLVGQAWAAAWAGVETIESPSGGAFPVYPAPWLYHNASGADLLIRKIEITDPDACIVEQVVPLNGVVVPDPSFDCEEGKTLPDGESCLLDGCAAVVVCPPGTVLTPGGCL